MENNVEQCGRVIDIRPGKVIVSILSSSMCSSCHAKGACGALDSKDKEIEVKTEDYNKYKIDDNVTVYMDRKLGFKAVFLGFLLPFLIMISLIFLIKFLFPEVLDIYLALSSLTSLVIYYYLIYLLRNKIDKEFVFKIKAQ